MSVIATRMKNCANSGIVFLLVALGLTPWGLTGFAADDWHVPSAPLRFEARIVSQPSDPPAGILAILPDGGILPKEAEPVVTTAAGAILKSACVWRNPREGLGAVFEGQPTGQRVFLYVQSGLVSGPSTGTTPFTPSLLLYTRAGSASLEEAKLLAKANPPGASAVMGQVPIIGHRENPFGPDDDYISYYVGWVKTVATGRTYICTVSDEGSEALIDGRVAASWPGLHTRQAGQKGEFGDWVNLTGGVHKVEYFHFEKAGDQEANLCWRLANVGKDVLPVTIPAAAYVRSGSALVVDVQARDGRPLSVLSAECRSYFWPKDKPVYLVELAALFTGQHPAGTIYTWTFENGLQTEGKTVTWLVDGTLPQDVTLTVKSGSGISKSTRPMPLKTTPPQASPNNSAYRQLYRDALLARCRAVPVAKRPCADWGPDLWAVLLAVIEPYKGKELLLEIFNRSRQDELGLDAESRAVLEDHFFETLRYADRDAANSWLDRLEQEEKSAARRFDWKLTRIEFTLYDLNDAAGAARLANQLLPQAIRPEDAVRIEVRLGDIERMSGRFEEARKRYSAAQDRYQQLFKNVRVTAALQGGTASRKPGEKPPTPSIAPNPVAEGWRISAVREATFRATVKNLIWQDSLFEARKVLQQWELELPLSKLSGDYPLAEAEYYMTVGGYERAWRVLKTYRAGVEISSSLPEAMTMELECLKHLKRDDDLKALAREIIKRFPAHPAAKQAQGYL